MNNSRRIVTAIIAVALSAAGCTDSGSAPEPVPANGTPSALPAPDIEIVDGPGVRDLPPVPDGASLPVDPALVRMDTGIAVVGGTATEDVCGEPLAQLLLLDMDASTWEFVPMPDGTGRRDPDIAWTGEELLVFGGTAGCDSGQPLGTTTNLIWSRADGWRDVAPSPLEPVADRVHIWTGASMILAGGTQTTATGAWDLATDSWYPLFPLPPDFDNVTQGVINAGIPFLEDTDVHHTAAFYVDDNPAGGWGSTMTLSNPTGPSRLASVGDAAIRTTIGGQRVPNTFGGKHATPRDDRIVTIERGGDLYGELVEFPLPANARTGLAPTYGADLRVVDEEPPVIVDADRTIVITGLARGFDDSCRRDAEDEAARSECPDATPVGMVTARWLPRESAWEALPLVAERLGRVEAAWSGSGLVVLGTDRGVATGRYIPDDASLETAADPTRGRRLDEVLVAVGGCGFMIELDPQEPPYDLVVYTDGTAVSSRSNTTLVLSPEDLAGLAAYLQRRDVQDLPARVENPMVGDGGALTVLFEQRGQLRQVQIDNPGLGDEGPGDGLAKVVSDLTRAVERLGTAIPRPKNMPSPPGAGC